MGIFDMNKELLQNIFQDAMFRADGDLCKAEEDPDVQQALCMYVNQHKNSNFNDALIIAEGGSLGYTPIDEDDDIDEEYIEECDLDRDSDDYESEDYDSDIFDSDDYDSDEYDSDDFGSSDYDD